MREAEERAIYDALALGGGLVSVKINELFGAIAEPTTEGAHA